MWSGPAPQLPGRRSTWLFRPPRTLLSAVTFPRVGDQRRYQALTFDPEPQLWKLRTGPGHFRECVLYESVEQSRDRGITVLVAAETTVRRVAMTQRQFSR